MKKILLFLSLTFGLCSCNLREFKMPPFLHFPPEAVIVIDSLTFLPDPDRDVVLHFHASDELLEFADHVVDVRIKRNGLFLVTEYGTLADAFMTDHLPAPGQTYAYTMVVFFDDQRYSQPSQEIQFTVPN